MLGVFEDFIIIIWEIILKVGVGFLVVLIGDVMMMFGLFKKFVVLNMDVINDGEVFGLF